MGFFSDLKEDLNQAVNELLPGGEKEETPEYEPEEMEMLKELDELEKTLQGIDQLQGSQASREIQVTMTEEPAVIEREVFRETEAIRAPEPVKAATPEPKPVSIPEPEPVQKPEPVVEPEIAKTPEPVRVEEPAAKPVAPAPEPEVVKEPVISIMEEPVKKVAPIRAQADFGAAYDRAEREREQIKRTDDFAKRPEGEKKVEEYGQTAAVKDGGAGIDKSWILDLRSMESMDETAVITAGMRVKGDILSNGHADVFGEVYGNVQVKGKLNVTGKIAGNSKAEEILADAAKINGDVISDGAIRIGVGTVIVGNVEATDAVIAGAVKGTIDVRGPVIIDATAVVLGNVRAKSIQINNGARIEGMCVLCYAEQSAAKFFEEQEQ